MAFLGLDIGSSSVKAGFVYDGLIIGKTVRAVFPTHFDGERAEVKGEEILKAISKAIGQLGTGAKTAEAIALSVMSPAWLAMDKNGKPLTPLITHQDRRAVAIAHELEKRVGKQRYLKIAGNLPFPGGISATTLAWFAKNSPEIIRKADLFGHLNTFLHRNLTGQRVIDPSNASFTGLYETVKQGTWNAELCRAAGAKISQLPRILESNVIAGRVTRSAAGRLGVFPGMPMLAGMIDTSAAMMLRGAAIGQLFNVCGSTDVLGLCVDHPHPNEKLLTRALGVGRKWMSVATLAAAGSAIIWMKDQFFSELPTDKYYKLVSKLARESKRQKPSVVFEPYLAGERTSIDQRHASFNGLTLATTRDEMLLAVIDALAIASGARLELLGQTGTKMLPNVLISGGTAKALHEVIHRDWPGHWRFKSEDESSLRGLSKLEPVECP